MKRIAWVALLLFVLPSVVEAWPGKRWRHRDDEAVRAKKGDYREDWIWARTEAQDDYCWRPLQRHQDRARNKLRGPGWVVFFISGDVAQDWMNDGKGDQIPGENPCLKPGVKPGLQPKVAGSIIEGDTAVSFESARVPFSISKPEGAGNIDCPVCYRDQGTICTLVALAEEDVRADTGHKDGSDHGIGRAARACRQSIKGVVK